MKALVLHQDKVLKYQDIEMPRLTDGDVLIKVSGCGICGSDLGRGFGGKAYHYPLVMGHEFAGIVESAFPGSRYAAGDRVVAFPLLPCKKCEACRTGDYAQCSHYDYFGSRRDGAFAEYIAVPEENLFRVPGHVDLLHATMTEPATVALHGVRRLQDPLGATAAVYGCGPVGNLCAQWLRIAGCQTVIVVDLDPVKLEIARQMGFTAINSLQCNAVEKIHELTGGQGAHLAIEAVGLPDTFLDAVRSVGRMGQVVFMGNIRGTFEMGEKDCSALLRKEIRIYGTWNSKIVPAGTDDWSTTLKMMDRELIVAPLISHTPHLSEGEQVFNDIINKRITYNKIIFHL
jgi:L-iditol 2-dehydrogenase/galactitol-1-phosphate 5-dehydrogenase